MRPIVPHWGAVETNLCHIWHYVGVIIQLKAFCVFCICVCCVCVNARACDNVCVFYTEGHILRICDHGHAEEPTIQNSQLWARGPENLTKTE